MSVYCSTVLLLSVSGYNVNYQPIGKCKLHHYSMHNRTLIQENSTFTIADCRYIINLTADFKVQTHDTNSMHCLRKRK